MAEVQRLLHLRGLVRHRFGASAGRAAAGVAAGAVAWVEILISCYVPSLVIILRHPNVEVWRLAPFEPIPAAPSLGPAVA